MVSPPATLPSVVISILNWNSWRDTLDCLESLRQLQYPNFLAVVADNASWDGSAERIKAWAEERLGPGRAIGEYDYATALRGGEESTEQALEQAPSPARLLLVRNPENLGFAGGNNLIIHYALARKPPSDLVFLLNNDSTVEPNCLTRLVETLDSAKVGIAEPAIFNRGYSKPEGPWIPSRFQISLERLFGNDLGAFPAQDNLQEVIAAHGSAMLLRADLLQSLFAATGEYLPDRFFMYLEDVGISLRARKLGYRCVRVNDAHVWHKGAASAGGKYNCLEYYYAHRNALLLGKELSGAGNLMIRVLGLPRIFGKIIKSMLRHQPAAARAVLAGLRDGYCGVGGKWKDHDQEVRRASADKSSRRKG
jgi:hypothetical protein